MVIYRIENLKNGKCYVGQTIQYEYRKRKHCEALNSNRHKNQHLQNSWNKYGKDAFEFELIEECDSIEELNKREKYWIEKLKTLDKNNGYNRRPGGRNFRNTERTKEKISKGLKKYYKNNKHPLKGFKHSEETKEKLSKIKSGVIQSKESIKKRTEKLKKEVHQYDLDGNYIQSFDSVKEAADKNNIDRSFLSSCARGECKTCGGYQWSYKKEKGLNKVTKGKGKLTTQYDLKNNKIKDYSSAKNASIKTGINHSNICLCCQGKRKTAGGYKWKYKTQNI